MRSISLTTRRAMNAQETGEVWASLVTIEHPSLSEPLRASGDNAVRLSEEPYRLGTISRGMTFTFIPMTFVLPDSVQKRAPSAQIQIENISRDLIQLVRSTSLMATVKMEFVLASTPDVVDFAFPKFQLQGARADASMITLDLQINAQADIAYPAGAYTPSKFPGLF